MATDMGSEVLERLKETRAELAQGSSFVLEVALPVNGGFVIH